MQEWIDVEAQWADATKDGEVQWQTDTSTLELYDVLQSQTVDMLNAGVEVDISLSDISQLQDLLDFIVGEAFDVSLGNIIQEQDILNLDIIRLAATAIYDSVQTNSLSQLEGIRIMSLVFASLAQSQDISSNSLIKILDGVLYDIVQNQRQEDCYTLTGIGVFLSHMVQWQQDSAVMSIAKEITSNLGNLSQQQILTRMGDHIKLASMLQTQGLSADQVAKAHPVVVDSIGQWQEVRDIWPFAIRGVAIGDILQRQEANMLVLFVSGDAFFVILNGHENTFIKFNPYQAVHVKGQLEERTFISFDAYQAVEIINRRDKLWVAQ